MEEKETQRYIFPESTPTQHFDVESTVVHCRSTVIHGGSNVVRLQGCEDDTCIRVKI